MSNPSVKDWMTATPHTVGREQTLDVASEMMRKHHFRHLPVLHAGKLEGVLSDRDIALVETLKDVDPKKVTVEEAMTQAPYTVQPEAALRDVAKEMAEHKYGAAIVVDGHGKVIGVFTMVDACRALSTVLGS